MKKFIVTFRYAEYGRAEGIITAKTPAQARRIAEEMDRSDSRLTDTPTDGEFWLDRVRQVKK